MNHGLLAGITLVASTFLASASPQEGELDPARVALARAHYARVEAELAARDVSALTPAQRERRALLIEELARYRERGDFGRRAVAEPGRVPIFVDDGGRHCAVANLLHRTGHDALVDAVRWVDNGAWVVDLAGDPAFASWLDAHGLSLWEAARIQLPTHGPPPSDTPPAETAPSEPSNSGGEGTGTRSRPRTAGGRQAPGGGGASRTGPSSPRSSSPRSTGEEDGWWLWWEFNKLRYLRPNAFDARSFPLSGDDTVDARTARMREDLEPLFVEACTDRDAGVRAAAVVALGRTAGARAVPHLVERLGDGSQLVRHRALLSLGATGAAEAQSLLMRIAREGAHESGASISPVARPLAIVALGIGRRAGFSGRADDLVLHLASQTDEPDRRTLGVAVGIYHTLAPRPEREASMARMAFEGGEPTEVRARALESLRSAADAEVLSGLQDVVHGRNLAARRSAALALGGFGHDLVAPALMTAFETEVEPMARGFLLVSLGQQGGPEALEFLSDVLKDGRHMTRPWAGLALGVLAAHDPDAAPAVAEALRARLGREKNRGARAALWLGLGLARDAASVETLAEALATGDDPRHRMYAATALSLIGDAFARAALLDRLEVETSQLVRAALAQGLGVIGHAADVPVLDHTVRDVSDPTLRGLAITALAFHGSQAAFVALREMAVSDSTSSAARANAFDALGLMVSAPEPLALAEVSRDANFTLFDDWVAELFQATL